MTLMEKFNSRLSSIVKIPELRERIIFTLLMFLVARVGTLIPAPGVDVDRLSSMASQSDVLSYINMFSGGAFTRISIFSLGNYSLHQCFNSCKFTCIYYSSTWRNSKRRGIWKK